MRDNVVEWSFKSWLNNLEAQQLNKVLISIHELC